MLIGSTWVRSNITCLIVHGTREFTDLMHIYPSGILWVTLRGSVKTREFKETEFTQPLIEKFVLLSIIFHSTSQFKWQRNNPVWMSNWASPLESHSVSEGKKEGSWGEIDWKWRPHAEHPISRTVNSEFLPLRLYRVAKLDMTHKLTQYHSFVGSNCKTFI